MMSDPKGSKTRFEMLRRFYEDAQKLAEPYRRAYIAALTEEPEIPPSLRFVNMSTNDAILKMLREESPDGADYDELREGLMAGGLSINKPNFDRDLKNSLKACVRNGILLRSGEKYLPGKKMPSHRVNWHKRTE